MLGFLGALAAAFFVPVGVIFLVGVLDEGTKDVILILMGIVGAVLTFAWFRT